MQSSLLPEATESIEQVQHDLAEFGVAILGSALPDARVAELRSALHQQAELERAQGAAFLEDGNLGRMGEGPNQRVFGLVGKGTMFRELAADARPLEVIRSEFGKSYGLPSEMVAQAELNDVLLSSLTANIVGEGGVEMMKHTDQAFMPPSTPYAAVINVIWPLDDFCQANGATLVAPGSHLEPEPHRFYFEPPEVVAVEALAGSAIFLDGRTWHGTGVNTTKESRSAIFAYYCRPFIRQQENFALSLAQEDVRDYDDALLSLLGFKVWFTLGGVEGASNGALVRG